MRSKKRAALLLEVIMALTIMVATLMVMCGPLTNGLRLTAYADQQTRAVELGDRLLALLELDQNTAQRVFLENQTDGDFGPEHPGYFWRVTIAPTDVEGLGWITIDVLYQDNQEHQLREDIEQAALVRRIGMLKAAPGRLDLNTDLGLDDEQVEKLKEVLAGMGLDPENLDPQAVANMFHVDTLPELIGSLLPLMAQFGGGSMANLGDLAGGGGGAPSLDQLEGLLGQLQSGNLPQGLDGMLNGGGGALPGGQLPGGLDGLDQLRDQLGGQGGGAAPRGQSGIDRGIRPGDGRGGQPGTPNSGNFGPGGPGRNGGMPPAGGRGNRAGAGNPGDGAGGNPGGANGGFRPGGQPGGNRGGQPGGNRSGQPGGNRGGGGTNAGGNNNGQPPRYTIEDLQRLRNELSQQQGGGGRRP